MSSSHEPASQSEPETTPEEYRQRALLMADLGRYDEAVEEIASGLAAAPADAALLTTLARVHVVAAQPGDALAAADRALGAAPGTIGPMIARGMALVDDRRFGEAAQVATEILTRWPGDPFAQRTGAGLLSEARNGQEALNAAWNGVRLQPADAEAHLVLAVVAARLRLFDLAQRAYSEALDLDMGIADAQRDVGVVRLERRRWATALEALADEATLQAAAAAPSPVAEVSKPVRSAIDRSSVAGDAFRQAVLFGTNAVLVAAVLTAIMTIASPGVARMWAGVIGVVVLIAVGVWLGRQLPASLGASFGQVRATSRRLAIAVGATALAPVLLVVFAVVGGLVPLIAAMVVAAVAELLVLTQRA